MQQGRIKIRAHYLQETFTLRSWINMEYTHSHMQTET